jgi:hypothetical protein
MKTSIFVCVNVYVQTLIARLRMYYIYVFININYFSYCKNYILNYANKCRHVIIKYHSFSSLAG